MDFRALDFWQQLAVGAVSILVVAVAIYTIGLWLSKSRARTAKLEASLFGSSQPTADIHHDWDAWPHHAK